MNTLAKIHGIDGSLCCDRFPVLFWDTLLLLATNVSAETGNSVLAVEAEDSVKVLTVPEVALLEFDDLKLDSYR